MLRLVESQCEDGHMNQTRGKIIAALHWSRMKPYLDAASQNKKKALALYQWHGELTAAVQEVLGITEVLLRNAIDRALQDWNNARLGTTSSWLLYEPATPLRSLSRGKRRSAYGRAVKESSERDPAHPRHGATVTHDDVLAQLMFGLWKDLLPNHKPEAGNNTENANRERLWEDALEAAFPNVHDPDGSETFWRVAHLHQLRNRVSHMEPLLNINVNRSLEDAFNLVQSIDDDIAAWVSGGSRVAAVMKRKPSV